MLNHFLLIAIIGTVGFGVGCEMPKRDRKGRQEVNRQQTPPPAPNKTVTPPADQKEREEDRKKAIEAQEKQRLEEEARKKEQEPAAPGSTTGADQKQPDGISENPEKKVEDPKVGGGTVNPPASEKSDDEKSSGGSTVIPKTDRVGTPKPSKPATPPSTANKGDEKVDEEVAPEKTQEEKANPEQEQVEKDPAENKEEEKVVDETKDTEASSVSEALVNQEVKTRKGYRFSTLMKGKHVGLVVQCFEGEGDAILSKSMGLALGSKKSIVMMVGSNATDQNGVALKPLNQFTCQEATAAKELTAEEKEKIGQVTKGLVLSVGNPARELLIKTGLSSGRTNWLSETVKFQCFSSVATMAKDLKEGIGILPGQSVVVAMAAQAGDKSTEPPGYVRITCTNSSGVTRKLK